MTVLPLPNYTLLITPPGGSAIDYTTHLTYKGSQNQMSITQNFGRQGDMATMVLTDDWQGKANPNFVIEPESQISLYDNTASKSLFAGVVTMPSLIPSANLNEWVLQCTDYTFYADNMYVAGTYNGYTIDNIIVDLTKKANCGINAATVANGGFVSPAPSLPKYSINYTKLSSVWRSLAQLASQSTPYGWYVDQNRNLHFVDATTASSSGVTFTTSPTVAGSLTEGHISRTGSFRYDFDGTTIHNRILVKGGNQTILTNRKSTPTGSWRSNGVQDSWGLKFTISGTPTLKINGKSTTVQVVNAGSTSTATWQVTQNANGQWYLTTRSVPSSGSLIQVWYDYKIPITAQVDDTQSQTTYTGPNGGIYEELVSDSSLTTMSMALARAQRERTEYAFAAERTTFDTTEEFFGYLRAGETFTYDNALINDSRRSNAWGVNGSFLCISNTVNFSKGGYRKMTPTGVRI